MTEESRSTFTLRASRPLLDALKRAADAQSHSMNAEIIQRLEASIASEAIPLDMDEFNAMYLEAAEIYLKVADDISVMRLLEKCFSARLK